MITWWLWVASFATLKFLYSSIHSSTIERFRNKAMYEHEIITNKSIPEISKDGKDSHKRHNKKKTQRKLLDIHHGDVNAVWDEH